MKRLIFALSMVFLIGLFAIPGLAETAHAYTVTTEQTQVTDPGSFRTVDWVSRDYVVEESFDRPVVRHHYYEEPVVRERIIEEEAPVYHRPGLSIGIPFFSLNLG